MSTDLVEVQSSQSTELSVETVLHRLAKIQELMKRAMDKDVDYGTIPGTQSKPTLLKPGAEKLCVMFRLAPQYKTVKTFHDDGHLTVESTCRILDMSQNFLGEASAMCSTRESKYAWRKSERTCPECGKPAILRSKFPPRDNPSSPPGWYCFAKKGGCGMNFEHDEPDIVNQNTGRIQNPDIADSYNTVLRIAEKRAYIAAVRLVTGSSALFDEEIPASNERDESDNGHNDPPASRPPCITNEEWKHAKGLLASHDIAWQDFLTKIGVKVAKDIRRDQLAPALDDIIVAAETKKWSHWLAEEPNLASFNAAVPGIYAIAHEAAKEAVWKLCWEYVERKGWQHKEGNKFEEKQ